MATSCPRKRATATRYADRPYAAFKGHALTPALANLVASEEIENDLLGGCPGDSGSRDRSMLSIERMLAGVG